MSLNVMPVRRSGAESGFLDSEARHFNSVVSRDGEFNPFTDRGWAELRSSFRSLVPGSENVRLLDIGCGTGQSRKIYSDRCSSYTGIDLSVAALAVASGRLAGDDFLAADAALLPFAEGAFDVVAFSSVLHHLSTPSRALAEAVRLLRPGGWAFAYDPNLLHPPMALFRHPRSPFYLSSGVSPNERPVLPGEVLGWFREAGLGEVVQHCRSGIVYRHVAPRVLARLLSLHNLGDAVLRLSGLDRWLGSFIITAARTPG